MCGGSNNAKTLAEEKADIAAAEKLQADADAKAATTPATGATGPLSYINTTNATYSNGVATLKQVSNSTPGPNTTIILPVQTQIQSNTSGKVFSLNCGLPTVTPTFPLNVFVAVYSNKTIPIANDTHPVAYACIFKSLTSIQFVYLPGTTAKQSDLIAVVPTDTFKIVSDGTNISYYKNNNVVFGPFPLDTLSTSYYNVATISNKTIVTVTIPVTFIDTAVAAAAAAAAAPAAAAAAADPEAAAAAAAPDPEAAAGLVIAPFINVTNATYSSNVVTLTLSTSNASPYLKINTGLVGNKFILKFNVPTLQSGKTIQTAVYNDTMTAYYYAVFSSPTSLIFTHYPGTTARSSSPITVAASDSFRIDSDGINVSYFQNTTIVFGPLSLDSITTSKSYYGNVLTTSTGTGTISLPVQFVNNTNQVAYTPISAYDKILSLAQNNNANPKFDGDKRMLTNKAGAGSTTTISRAISLNGNDLSMSFQINQLSPTSTSGSTNFGFQFGLPAAPTPPYAPAFTPFYVSIGYDGTLTLNGATTTPALPTAKLVVEGQLKISITSSSATLTLNHVDYTINVGTGPYVPGNVGCSFAFNGTGATGGTSTDMIFNSFMLSSTIRYKDTPITFPSVINLTTANPMLLSSNSASLSPAALAPYAGYLMLATSATPVKTISPSITLVPNAKLKLSTRCNSLGGNATVGKLYFGFTCGSDSVILSISYNGSVSLIGSTNSTTDWTTTPELPTAINASDSFSILITPNAVTIDMTISNGSGGGSVIGAYTLNFKNVPYVPGNVSCNFFTHGIQINGNAGMSFKEFAITSSVQDVKVISGFQNPTNTKNSYSFQGYYPSNSLTGMDYHPF